MKKNRDLLDQGIFDVELAAEQEVMEQLEDYQTGIIHLTLDTERAARFIPWE